MPGFTTVATNLSGAGAATYPPAIAAAVDLLSSTVLTDLAAVAAGAGVAGRVALATVTAAGSTIMAAGGTYVSATQTYTGPTGLLVVDGVTAATGMRLLLAGEAVTSFNGIYTVANPGGPTLNTGASFSLVRAADASVSGDFQPGMLVATSGLGKTNGGAIFSLAIGATAVLDTTGLTFSKIASLNEFAPFNISTPLAGSVGATTAFPEQYIAGLPGKGALSAIVYVPFVGSGPGTTASATLTVKRYPAGTTSGGGLTVGTFGITSGGTATAAVGMTFGALSNAAYGPGDTLSFMSTLGGLTALTPAGVLSISIVPN